MRPIDADALAKELMHEGLGYQYNRIMYAPTVNAVPIQYILTTIREWNRDGYAESAEALENLLMNWDKDNTELAERKEE